MAKIRKARKYTSPRIPSEEEREEALAEYVPTYEEEEIAKRKEASEFLQEPHVVSRDFQEHKSAGDWGGLDLVTQGMEGRLGSPIYPTVGGKVIFSGQLPGKGWTVTIEDAGGNLHHYAHLDGQPSVVPGMSVEQWDRLGGMGDSGRSIGVGGGTHLHYEVTNPQGQNVNPEAYLYGTYLQGSQDAYAKATDPIFNAQMLANIQPTTYDPNEAIYSWFGAQGAPVWAGGEKYGR